MKQHITLKQLNELSKKGKEKLRKWWKPEWWHLFIWTKEGQKGIQGDGGMDRKVENILWTNYITTPKEDNPAYKYLVDHKNKGWILPILSIGQLIEYLYENKVEVEDLEMLTFDDSTPFICDSLWELVKEHLDSIGQ